MSQDDKAPSFGAHVRQLREERGLTREQLSEASDLAVDTIGKIERDEVSPSLRSVRKLALGLGFKKLSELFAEW